MQVIAPETNLLTALGHLIVDIDKNLPDEILAKEVFAVSDAVVIPYGPGESRPYFCITTKDSKQFTLYGSYLQRKKIQAACDKIREFCSMNNS